MLTANEDLKYVNDDLRDKLIEEILFKFIVEPKGDWTEMSRSRKQVDIVTALVEYVKDVLGDYLEEAYSMGREDALRDALGAD